TGDLPFHGESSAVICEAIMNRVPVPMVRLNHNVPPKLEDIINKALEKDRNLRYQNAADIRTDLQRLKRDTESSARFTANANASGDANTDYLSDGITESVIAGLTHVPDLKVKSRNSVFRYKGKDVDMQKVGNDLGVSALVSGRVTPHGDSIEVSAELTDVRD